MRVRHGLIFEEVSVLIEMIGDSLLETCNLNELIENIPFFNKYLIINVGYPGFDSATSNTSLELMENANELF